VIEPRDGKHAAIRIEPTRLKGRGKAGESSKRVAGRPAAAACARASGLSSRVAAATVAADPAIRDASVTA
jgi:hypothetical protein